LRKRPLARLCHKPLDKILTVDSGRATYAQVWP
jgi:hypothetical protein